MPARMIALIGTLLWTLTLSPAIRADAPPDQLSIPGRTSSAPAIAGAGRMVVVVFAAADASGQTDIYAATSSDAGRTFGAPVRVNTHAGAARVGGELPPRVALAASGQTVSHIFIAWGERRAGGIDLRLARSTDAGRSFHDERTVQASGAPGDRGWHALAVDAAGNPQLIWLDHRGLAESAGESTRHAHRTGPRADGAPDDDAAAAAVAMAQKSALYHWSGDTAERSLAAGVCYCCKTALTTTPDGAIYAAWRHVYQGSVRDIAFAVSRDGGASFSSPRRVSEDEWQIAGCPDDGPAMDASSDGTVHIVWPTLMQGPEPQAALFVAESKDGTRFTPRRRVPTLGGPRPMHPQIVSTRSQSTIVWDEVQPGGKRVAGWVTIERSRLGRGEAKFTRPRVLARDAAYPVLAETNDGIVAAWVSGPHDTATIAVSPLVR